MLSRVLRANTCYRVCCISPRQLGGTRSREALSTNLKRKVSQSSWRCRLHACGESYLANKLAMPKLLPNPLICPSERACVSSNRAADDGVTAG